MASVPWLTHTAAGNRTGDEWLRVGGQHIQGVIMSESDELRNRVQQMRAKVKDLKAEAERATDPEERRRLKEKARRIESESEQVSGMASGDIYPMK